MPTVNPRVNLTLTPDQYDLISRAAKVQGTSRSRVFLEFFEMVFPVLERVVLAAEAASRMQVQAKEGLQAAVERAEAALAPHAAVATEQLDLLLAAAVGASGGGKSVRKRAQPAQPARRDSRRSSPRAVTRGPGRGASTPRKSPPRGSRP